MSRWQRALAVFVAIEFAAAAIFVGRLAMRPAIPAVALDHVDAEVAGAIAWHQRGMDLSSSDDWQSLAKLYLAFGCLPEAESCCREAAELAPGSKEAFYSWAVVLERLGRLPGAEEKLTKAMELGVVESEAWVRLGRIRMRQEHAEAAAEAFRTALEKSPDQASAAIGLARILLRAGRPEEAAGVIRPLVAKHPRAHAPCQLLSRAEAALGRKAEADELLAKAEWRPEVLPFVDPRADADRWAASVGALRWATESRAAAAKGDAQTAALLIQRALDLGWDDRFALEAAAAFLQIKQPQEALAMLGRTTAAAGKSGYAAWLQGEAYAMLGKSGLAQDAWEESVKLRGSEAAHRRLAEAHRPQEALAQRHRALALYFAALGHLQAGERERAEESLRESLKIEPAQGMAWRLLGNAERVAGRDDAARQAYRRCLEIRPEDGRAQDSLHALETSAKPAF
jgi:tetratricopeptide (TPR) repeat protein